MRKKELIFATNKVLIIPVALILFSVHVNAQIAESKCKFLGNIISGYQPSDFTQYWNQVTPENAGKWGSAEPTRDVMSWAGLDLAYNTARNNGFLFKQHTFVWGQQQPGWISTLSQAEQKEEIEEWIKSYCERYPETDFIDVVNEPIHAVPTYAAALGGGGTTGWDWVIWSFEKARAYCPNAKLILNEYNVINNDGATNMYLGIINLLKQRNLIDGIGEQGHFLETTPIATIKSNLDKLHATGLPIYISEYDINILDNNLQRDKYQELFPVLWTHPGVQGITLWGYREGEIWRENAFLIRSNGTERPALTWLKSYVPTVPGGSFCLPITGIREELSPVKVYPNPSANGIFKLQLIPGNSEIHIIDLFGRKIKHVEQRDTESVTIQLDEPSGVYVLQVENGGKKFTKKIVIE